MISVKNKVVRMFGKWPPNCLAEKKVRQYIMMNLRKIICENKGRWNRLRTVTNGGLLCYIVHCTGTVS